MTHSVNVDGIWLFIVPAAALIIGLAQWTARDELRALAEHKAAPKVQIEDDGVFAVGLLSLFTIGFAYIKLNLSWWFAIPVGLLIFLALIVAVIFLFRVLVALVKALSVWKWRRFDKTTPEERFARIAAQAPKHSPHPIPTHSGTQPIAALRIAVVILVIFGSCYVKGMDGRIALAACLISTLFIVLDTLLGIKKDCQNGIPPIPPLDGDDEINKNNNE